MCENDVEGVERSLNSFNCYSCYCTHVERVESGVCGLCTQYRYIQCYVERVERLCYVETRDKHIFAHNFLNIQAIFNPKKVLESWDLDLFNHTIQYHVCWRGWKLFRLSTPSTCFDIHCIGLVWLERSKSQLSKTFFGLKIACLNKGQLKFLHKHRKHSSIMVRAAGHWT